MEYSPKIFVCLSVLVIRMFTIKSCVQRSGSYLLFVWDKVWVTSSGSGLSRGPFPTWDFDPFLNSTFGWGQNVLNINIQNNYLAQHSFRQGCRSFFLEKFHAILTKKFLHLWGIFFSLLPMIFLKNLFCRLRHLMNGLKEWIVKLKRLSRMSWA